MIFRPSLERSLLLWAVVLLLNGCAALSVAVPDRALARIRTVGVISVLGDDTHSYLVTTSEFVSFGSVEPFPKWRMDDYAQRIVADTLNPRYRYTALSYDPQKLRQSFTGNGRRPSLSQLEPLLRAIVDTSPVDAIVVISLATKPDPINALPVRLTGYGVYRVMAMIDMAAFEANMFVNVDLTVVDGHTLKTLTSVTDFAFQEEHEAAWDQETSRLPPPLQKKLEHTLKALLGASLRGMVKDVGL